MTKHAPRRLGRNEALFRQVNEGIERGLWPEDGRLIRFRCECARLDCNTTVKLTVEEYEAVRQDGRRFAVRPGHEAEEGELVVVRTERYFVVEKRGEAGEVASATDPRG